MSEISIQIRRVTERVKQYYTIFGLRPSGTMRPGRSVIRGSKRLGFDEIECVVAETARGTSVGFYAINQLQGILHLLPFLILLIVTGLNEIPSLTPFFSGTEENSLNVDIPKLLAGNYSFNFIFVLSIMILGALFIVTELIVQRIRLDTIKSRFSFYSRDAIWETKDVPSSLIGLQAFRSIFNHIWMLSIIYFAIFSSQGEILNQLSIVYNSSVEALYVATIDAFVITGGLVLGLLLSYKSLLLRREYGKFDDRVRVSGGLTERRIDPILFGVQSAMMGGGIIIFFLSLTFLQTANAEQLGIFVFFILLGAVIGGAIFSEGDLWILASYAVFIFFTSLILIFQTGSQPAYAYIVVLQLFFIPIPFAILISANFEKVLRKNNIRSKDWYFDILPITAILSLYFNRKRDQKAKKVYEDSLAEEISVDTLDRRIMITKNNLTNNSTYSYRLVRHYFELLFTYTASFEENQFVTLPTTSQLDVWWRTKTGQSFTETQTDVITTADQLLWDPDFEPADESIKDVEGEGKNMVLALQ